jgi:predicted PurR-regulated permease PerM
VSILLFFIATYLLADWLPNMLLRPRMSAGRLHKGLLLLSYIFGPMVFGFKGLFLGPMVLVFAINFAEVVMPEIARK